MYFEDEPRKGDWVQVFCGTAMWPMDPRPDEINIIDIANSLSKQCRFTGHCLDFYSVGEHSVRVSVAIENALAPNVLRDELSWSSSCLASLCGLLHDASEFVLSDISRPVKPYLSNYVQIEEDVMEAVAGKFGLPWPMPAIVKRMDNTLLATEARDLMVKPPMPWAPLPDPLPEKIKPWSHRRACKKFLRRYEFLVQGREHA